jgi:N-acetylglucosamine-6-phosphate deacetylase
MGSLEEGKDANIVIADSNVDVYATIVDGREVFGA